MVNKKLVGIATLIIVTIIVLSYVTFILTRTGPGPVEIQITADKSSYVQGENVTFTIKVNNPQDWRVEKPSAIMYRIGTYGVGANIDYAFPDYFPAHSTTISDTYVWDQRDDHREPVVPGNYTLIVTYSGPVDYGEPGSCTITILPTT